MQAFASFSVFVTRLLLTSIMALCFQIFLIVKQPDYLLTVQEAVRTVSRATFQFMDMQSSYQVAYNLINGDGLIVHTFFVFLAFILLFLIFLPGSLLRRGQD